jgi:polar amino acid transport system substrate-binding protein
MQRLGRWFLWVWVLFLYPVLAQSAPSPGALDQIKTRKEVLVGLDTGFIPFAMKKADGNWVGYDIDLSEGFAKFLGVKLTLVEMKWEGMFAALQAKRFDIIIHGITITEDRKKTLRFSDPYYEAGQYALIAKSQVGTIKRAVDLNDAKYTVAVQLGTTGDIWATKNLPKANLLRFDSEHDAANAVMLGKVAGFIYDKPYLLFFSKRHAGKIVMLPEALNSEYLGAVARKNDAALIDAFNTFLAGWKKSGEYDKAIQKNFVDMPWLKFFPELNKS